MKSKTHIPRKPADTRLCFRLLLVLMALMSTCRMTGQSNSDTVCQGSQKHYWVDETIGSFYSWRIDTTQQPTFTHEIFITWDSIGFFSLTVQEKSAEDCWGDAKTSFIKVNPMGQVNQPSDLIACNGASTGQIIFTTINTGSGTTYAWTNNNINIGLAGSGTGNIPSFTALNSESSPDSAIIVVTPFYIAGNDTCPGIAKTFKIFVLPTGQMDQPADQVVCNLSMTEPVTFTTSNTGGFPTYSWTNNNTSIGLPPYGDGNIQPFIAINNGDLPVGALITVIPHFTIGSTSCDGPPRTFTFTVYPGGQVDQPANQSVCPNSATSAVIFTTTSISGTTIFNWTNSNPAIGLPAFGNGNIPSFIALNNGNSPDSAIITVTPFKTTGAMTCRGPSKTFIIWVNPRRQMEQPVGQMVCDSTMTKPIIFKTLNPPPITAYDWTNDTPGIGLAPFGTGDTIHPFKALNAGSQPLWANVNVTPKYTYGSVTCQGNSKSFIIPVNPTGQVNQPNDTIICNGLSTSVIFSTNNAGGITIYSWTNSNTNIGLGSRGRGNLLFTATNNGTVPDTAVIWVTPLFANDSISSKFTNDKDTCDGNSRGFYIIVNPTVQMNQPANQVVCNNDSTLPVIFTTNITGGTTTYTWVNNNPGIGLDTTGTGPIGRFLAINIGHSPIVGTITVTPHFTVGTTTCDGDPEIFTITVNPTGQLNNPG
ncbi:MAG: hypothetical protein WCL00_13315, partial [Bacteroidota bacterium]